MRGTTFEVILIDNASQDGCEKLIREEFPQVVFIQSADNLGFARANNLGHDCSHGEYLLFLNPDTEIKDGALLKLLSHLCSNPSLGAVGARLLNTDGSTQLSCVQAFPTICNQLLDSDCLRRWFPTWRGWGIGPLVRKQIGPAEVDAISGACFMVKRSVFERVGKFSEAYFMYADDLDLSYKINQAGYTIHYLNDCEIVHHGGKSSAKQTDHFSDLWQRESLVQFFRLTRGEVYSVLYRLGLAIVAAVRLVMVASLIACGRRRIQGRASGFVLQKWSKILRWSVGFGSHMQKDRNAHAIS
jgi:GT2 family glycosyltransferase